MRKFGIEIETCVIAEYNSEFDWIDYVKIYLEKVFDNWISDKELVTYTKKFDNKIFIKTEKYDSDADFYIFDLTTHLLTLSTEIYEINYDYPTLAPDYSVICHDYVHGFINDDTHPSEWDERSYHASQYGINKKLFSFNLELITQILESFNEYELFEKLMMPSTVSFLKNKSQGIHLNIDISDISTSMLKNILINSYYSWEQAKARLVRPNKSIHARELEYQDILQMSTFHILGQFSNILTKYTSVYLKSDLEVLEFRIFSPSGNNIHKHIIKVYDMFSNKNKKGGKRYTKTRHTKK